MLVFYDHMVLEEGGGIFSLVPTSLFWRDSFPDDHFQDIINTEAKENTTAGHDALLGNKHLFNIKVLGSPS